MRSLAIAQDAVTSVLIGGDWYDISGGTFEIDWYDFADQPAVTMERDVPPDVLGFAFTTAAGEWMAGPLTSIDAVKLAAGRG